MATLQELRARKVYTPAQWVRGSKLFVISGLGGVASHLLYNLLFRLENTENGATVVLFDGMSGNALPVVSEQDVKEGLYTPNDIGKTRIDVLIDRYTEVFSTTIFAGSQYFLTSISGGLEVESNVYYLDLTEPMYTDDLGGVVEGHNLQESFESLAERGAEHSRNYATVFMRAFTTGNRSTLQFRVVNEQGRILGDAFNYEDQIQNEVGNSRYVRNQAVSMYLFNYINALISEGMFVEYSKLEGDILRGEDQLTRTYFKAPLVTIFDKYDITVWEIERSKLVEFKESWEARYREVVQDVYPQFIERFNIHRGRKYITAAAYLEGTYSMLGYGMEVLARQRTQSDIAQKLGELMDRLRNTSVYSFDEEEDIQEHIKTVLTLIQFEKVKGLWFI